MKRLTALTLVFACGCAEAAPPRERNVAPKLELSGATVLGMADPDRPLVEAVLPGRGSMRLLIDTGADVTLLDRAFVERMGLDLFAFPIPYSVQKMGRSQVFEHYSRIERLELGTASIEGLEPFVSDLSHFSFSLDGLLGMDVLAAWAVLFDAAGGEVRLIPSEGVVDELTALYADGTVFQGLPLTWRGMRPSFSFDFSDGLSRPMVLDTGSKATYLPQGVPAALGLTSLGPNTSQDIAGTLEVEMFEMPKLTLGPTAFTHFGALESRKEEGLIGWWQLRLVVFVVDGPAEHLLVAHEAKRR